MNFMPCPGGCGSLVFSLNAFFCETCWLKDMEPYAQIIYALDRRVESRIREADAAYDNHGCSPRCEQPGVCPHGP